MVVAGVPPDVIGAFFAAVQAGLLDFQVLTGVGGMGPILAAALPTVAPSIDAIVQARDVAFSIATAQTFWLGVGGAIAAAVAAVAIKEIPLRTTNEAPVPTHTVGEAAAASKQSPDPVGARTVAGD